MLCCYARGFATRQCDLRERKYDSLQFDLNDMFRIWFWESVEQYRKMNPESRDSAPPSLAHMHPRGKLHSERYGPIHHIHATNTRKLAQCQYCRAEPATPFFCSTFSASGLPSVPIIPYPLQLRLLYGMLMLDMSKMLKVICSALPPSEPLDGKASMLNLYNGRGGVSRETRIAQKA